MKKVLLIILCLTTVWLYNCDKKAESNRVVAEIVLDGDATDWTSYNLLSYDKPKITFGISNDDNFLYILAAFNDRSLNRMFGLSGLELWLSADGKKDRAFGIRYVGPAGAEVMQDDTGDMPEEMRERMIERIKNVQRGMTLIVNGLEVSPQEGRIPEVAFQSSHGNSCLEYRIPLQNGAGERFAIDIPENGKVLLGFEMSPPEGMNTMTQMQPEGDMADRAGGGMTGSMGGRGGMGGTRGGTGGGMGGRGGQPGGQRDAQTMSKQEVWIQIALAGHPGK